MEPAEFDREFERFLDENFPREPFPALRGLLDQGRDERFRPHEMYEFIRETRQALRMFASQQQQSRLGLTLYFPWHLVSGWKIDRLRTCENCDELFLADRANKLTCKPACSTARRVREWRKKQPQYEQARKLKGATSAKPVVRRTIKKGGKHGTQQAR
jgi:hypothetical protein